MINYSFAKNNSDLEHIIELQQANHYSVISKEEQHSEGYVTVQHDLALLQKMNEQHPHIVAKDGNKVVGYSLSMLRNFAEDVPQLTSFIHLTDILTDKGLLLSQLDYFIMGQVCVAKNYRGKNIFNSLYQKQKQSAYEQYPVGITEVAVSNQRSMIAHKKLGYKTLKSYEDSSKGKWEILIWDWR